MISKYSLRIVKLAIWVCSFFWICETKWSKEKKKFVTKRTIRVPMMLGFQIGARFYAITYFGLFLLLSDNPILSWDFRIGVAWVFQCLVTAPWWVWNIKNRRFWGFLFNQTLNYNKNLGELEICRTIMQCYLYKQNQQLESGI